MKKIVLLTLCLALMCVGCSAPSSAPVIDQEKLELYCAQMFNPVINRSFQEGAEQLKTWHAGTARDYIIQAEEIIAVERERVSELNGFDYTADCKTSVVSKQDSSYRITAYVVILTDAPGMTGIESHAVYDFVWNESSKTITALEVEVYA